MFSTCFNGSPISREGSHQSFLDGDSDLEEDDATAVDEVVERIDRCLRHYLRTRIKIGMLFRRYADEESDDGRPGLSKEQAEEMLPEVCEALRLPDWVFNGQSLLFERFDFYGNGLLNQRACDKMYMSTLRQRRLEFGGRKREVLVPESTMTQAGYTVMKELGRGGQGAMYLCTKRFSWRNYCVKFYDKKDANAGGLQELIEEFSLMKELSSPYVAKTYEIFQDRSFYYLVNEPYTGGDLTKLGKRAGDAGIEMSERWWRGIFKQCLDGVNYLHQHAIIHCDVKEPNIMIADGRSYTKPRPVLIDFGLSTVFGSKMHQICGTPGYIPPETWREGVWYPSGDVFSLGITFFQLIIGRVPEAGVMGVLQTQDLAACVTLAERQPLPWEAFPKSMSLLGDLLAELTCRDRTSRPRCPVALQHEWFSSDGDARLPEASIMGLVGRATEREALDALVRTLVEGHNLDELRLLELEFVRADPMAMGKVSVDSFWQLLGAREVPTAIIEEYAKATLGHTCKDSDKLDYLSVIRTAIDLKKEYDRQYLLELFDALDLDKTGVNLQELGRLLNGDGFEVCGDDVQGLVARMGAGNNNTVRYEQFQTAIIEDGRVARRPVARQSIWERHFAG